MSRSMCEISIDTVIRANKRTIQQNRSQQIRFSHPILKTSELSVSVSVMGVIHSRTISTQEIKDSFSKAINSYAKKL